MNKTVVVLMDEIKEEFFVRTHLHQERVDFFIKLYEAGAEVPVLKLMKGNVLIDGRHRKAALIALGRKEVECEIISAVERPEAIVLAVAAKFGGPMSPTEDDMRKVVGLLIEQRLSGRKIVDLMCSKIALPNSIIAKYVDEVRTGMRNVAVSRAVRSILNDGMTLEGAAERHGVNEQQIRNRLSTDGLTDRESAQEKRLANVLAGFSSTFTSTSRTIGTHLKHTLKQYELGLVDEAYVKEVMGVIDRGLRRLRSSHSDWEKRFDVQIGKESDENHVVPKVDSPKRSNTKSSSSVPSGAEEALKKMGLA